MCVQRDALHENRDIRDQAHRRRYYLIREAWRQVDSYSRVKHGRRAGRVNVEAELKWTLSLGIRHGKKEKEEEG